ncbi:MAG TPA: hypothetical protein ENI70_00325 [Candidatus Peregrinibacteria bacterium]|nr:hypothetical protein [Candidatus Peregrinibacteria bacterium]
MLDTKLSLLYLGSSLFFENRFDRKDLEMIKAGSKVFFVFLILVFLGMFWPVVIGLLMVVENDNPLLGVLISVVGITGAIMALIVRKIYFER